jgi:hypothetical protein
MPDCARCKKPLGTKYTLFLDRKYHTHPCYVVTLVRYKELREPMRFDELPLKTVNLLLEHLQWADPPKRRR